MNQAIFSSLADVRAWERKDKLLSPLDLVALEGKPSLLFGYAALMNPELVEADGELFLANGFSMDLLKSWNSKGVCGMQAQRVINHIHIRYIMQEYSEECAVLNAGAECLSDVWNKTLPKELTIEIVEPGTTEVALTFFRNN